VGAATGAHFGESGTGPAGVGLVAGGSDSDEGDADGAESARPRAEDPGVQALETASDMTMPAIFAARVAFIRARYQQCRHRLMSHAYRRYLTSHLITRRDRSKLLNRSLGDDTEWRMAFVKSRADLTRLFSGAVTDHGLSSLGAEPRSMR
jgi:hypothetical protein